MPKLKEEEKLINIKVNKNFHYKLKLQALKENTTMQTLIMKVMDKYITQEENESELKEYDKRDSNDIKQENKEAGQFRTFEQIRENFQKQEEQALETLLAEGYSYTKKEDRKINKEWEVATLENWNE